MTHVRSRHGEVRYATVCYDDRVPELIELPPDVPHVKDLRPPHVRHREHVQRTGVEQTVTMRVTVDAPPPFRPGVGEIEMCTECGRMTVRCLHEVNEWNDSGTMLACVTCGADGT